MPETKDTTTPDGSNIAALSQTLTALGGLAAALLGVQGAVATGVVALLGGASKLLQSHVQGGVSAEQWDEVHAETADVLAQINARRGGV